MKDSGFGNRAELGNRIRRARAMAALSQQQLAAFLGIHRSAVAQWESQRGAYPTVANTIKLAIATGVSIEWLATGRGPMDFAGADQTGASAFPDAAPRLLPQADVEARAILSLRKLEQHLVVAIVEMIESMARPDRRSAKPRSN